MSGVYWMEAKMELRKMARLKQYSLSVVGFPLMFYIFFGLAMGSSFLQGPVSLNKYLLATYGACSVIGATLFAFGAGLRISIVRGLTSPPPQDPKGRRPRFLARPLPGRPEHRQIYVPGLESALLAWRVREGSSRRIFRRRLPPRLFRTSVHYSVFWALLC